MRLRELRKLVEQVVAGGGGLNPGPLQNRSAEFGMFPQLEAAIVPLDPTRLTQVRAEFNLVTTDPNGSPSANLESFTLADWDDPAVETFDFKTSLINLPGVSISDPGSLTVTLEVIVPIGGSYSVLTMEPAPESGGQGTRIELAALFERTL